MKKITLVFFLLLCLSGRAFAWEERPLHDSIVGFFKEIEAVFSWHLEDRKTLKEVAEETAQGILS